MKVAFYDLEGWEISIIKRRLKGKNFKILTSSKEGFDHTKLKDVKKVEILSTTSRLDKNLIKALPDLKLISVRSTGYDNVDIDFCKKKGIAVTNVPVYGEETVAEYTFGLILTLSRKMSMTFLRTLFGMFERRDLRGMDLSGKTIGVVGTGRIASRVIKMAHAFEMKILCYDLYPKQELVDKYNAKYVELNRLLSNSDVITIHVPYTKDTHHLINEDSIKLIKKGTLLINAARGAIVDTTAVLRALEDGRLGGVALDTFEGEEILIGQESVLRKSDEDLPLAVSFKKSIEATRLLRFRNVVLTPHNAFNTKEAVKRILNTSLDGIVSFATKDDCECRVV